MGALPKRRISTRRGGKRLAVKRLKLASLTKCFFCGQKKIFRTLCPNCKK